MKYPSRFTQLLALGWYDGPTNGLVRTDDRAWKFDMIHEIQNPNGLDLRLFALAPIPVEAWDGLVAALSQFHKPSWPAWLPRWQFPTEADFLALNTLTADLMQQASPVDFLIAAKNLISDIIS